jgi:hypothetical protein
MGTADSTEVCENKPTCGLIRPLQSPFSETDILNFDRLLTFADLGKIDDYKSELLYYYHHHHRRRYPHIVYPFGLKGVA